MPRGKKPTNEISKRNLLKIVLKNGGCFTEFELTEMLYGVYDRDKGVRGDISVLRNTEYCPIAFRKRINRQTGRIIKGYYWEFNSQKWEEFKSQYSTTNWDRGALPSE